MNAPLEVGIEGVLLNHPEHGGKVKREGTEMKWERTERILVETHAERLRVLK